MEVVKTAIPGVIIVEPKRFGDTRGFFTELYRAERYAAAGIALPFVQDNFSRSAKGVLRGKIGRASCRERVSYHV